MKTDCICFLPQCNEIFHRDNINGCITCNFMANKENNPQLAVILKELEEVFNKSLFYKDFIERKSYLEKNYNMLCKIYFDTIKNIQEEDTNPQLEENDEITVE